MRDAAMASAGDAPRDDAVPHRLVIHAGRVLVVDTDHCEETAKDEKRKRTSSQETNTTRAWTSRAFDSSTWNTH